MLFGYQYPGCDHPERRHLVEFNNGEWTVLEMNLNHGVGDMPTGLESHAVPSKRGCPHNR